MTKQIIALWAQDNKGLIGKEGRLPWHLPAELKHFKETTIGQAILMGRVTFDGMNRRVLPNRQVLILTRDQDFEAEGVQVFHSRQEVLDWYAQQDKTLFIVGGSQIYQTFEEDYDQLMVTEVEGDFEGDAYFPALDFSAYQEMSQNIHEKDDHNPHSFRVRVLRKE